MLVQYDTLTRAPIPKRLLVIGSPRSGTQFITGLLNRFGLRVRHERMGEDGTVNCAWLVYRIKNDPLIQISGRQHYEFDQIVHIVRHPFAVIASLSAEMYGVFWDWQYRHSNIRVNPKLLSTVANFWMFWSDGCQKLSDSMVRLEDIAHLGERKNAGIHEHMKLSLDSFEDEEIREALERRCKRYGYKTDGSK
jgi:hypothetical protein